MSYVYHERQEAALCGVHCLNTLLQGAYFGPTDLGEIARNFDENEQQLMLEMGETNDFLKYMAEESGNVSDSGFFSVQVLGAALVTFDLTLVSIKSEAGREAKQNPLNENAFICNLEQHWFTIRKINGKWLNLNSMYKKPEILSDFYLSAFLDTLLQGGYEIFVVRGQLPPIVPQLDDTNWIPFPSPNAPSSRSSQAAPMPNASGTIANFFSDVLQSFSTGNQFQNQMQFQNNDSYDDDDLKAAIAASLAYGAAPPLASPAPAPSSNPSLPSPPNPSPPSYYPMEFEMDADLKAALAASMADCAAAPSPSPSPSQPPLQSTIPPPHSPVLDEDEELRMALLLSQQSPPPAHVATVVNIFPASDTPANKISKLLIEVPEVSKNLDLQVVLTATLEDVANYVKSQFNLSGNYVFTLFPRTFTNLANTLEELNLFPRVKLIFRRG